MDLSKCLTGTVTCIIIMICLLYIISPIDFLPDFIPIIGWIDDAMAGLVLVGTLLMSGMGSIFSGGIFGKK